MIQNNRQTAHQEIDHIFKELLPAHGMAERPAQVALSHRMLDAMLDDSIAPVSYTHLTHLRFKHVLQISPIQKLI